MNCGTISVIVPVYNVQEYIRMCINSICNQTYDNLEIILVNDGSVDNSGAICDEYARNDKRIQVIHKENEGLVQARRTGVKMCTGEYVYFVDSDDWIESDTLEKLFFYVDEGVDLVTGDLILVDEDDVCSKIFSDSFETKKYCEKEIQQIIIPEMMYCYLSRKQGIVASACNKLFRRSILEKIIDAVDERLSLGEDGALVYTYITHIAQMSISHVQGYHYVQHANSMIKSFSMDSYNKIKLLQEQLRKTVISVHPNKEEQIRRYVAGFFVKISENIFQLGLNAMVFVPPYELIPRDSKVIIYGAGAVGKGYYGALSQGNYTKVVGWVDKYNFGQVWNEGYIKSINEVEKMKYDYILIAVADREIADVIQKELMLLGVENNRILWNKPVIYYM